MKMETSEYVLLIYGATNAICFFVNLGFLLSGDSSAIRVIVAGYTLSAAAFCFGGWIWIKNRLRNL